MSSIHIKTSDLVALLLEKPAQADCPAQASQDFLKTLQSMYANHQVWKVDRRLDLIQKFIRKASITPDDLTTLYCFNHQKTLEYIRKICDLDQDEYEVKKARPYELVNFMEKVLSDRRKRILVSHIEIHDYLRQHLSSLRPEKEEIIPLEPDPGPGELPEEAAISSLPIKKAKRRFYYPGRRRISQAFIMVGASSVILFVTLFFHGEINGYFLQDKADDMLPVSLTSVGGGEPGVSKGSLPASQSPAVSEQGLPETGTSLTLTSLQNTFSADPTHPSEQSASKKDDPRQDEAKDHEITPSLPDSLGLLPLNIIRGRTEEKKIALTFDGDSRGQDTPKILAILRRYGLTCTFFLTGHFMENSPDEVLTIVADGHEVGNHTYSHPHLKDITEQEFAEELLKTEELFHEITGRRLAPYWRAPYGEYSPSLARVARKLGYLHIHWTHWRGREHSLDTIDWLEDESSKLFSSSEEIVQHILKSPYKSGGIVLLHVGARTVDPPYLRFPELIEGLKHQDYSLVPVTDLINDLLPLGLAHLNKP